MGNYLEIAKKLETETVYLYNEIENLVIKLLPKDGKNYAKWAGGEEYEVDLDSDAVFNARLAANEITKEKYNKF